MMDISSNFSSHMDTSMNSSVSMNSRMSEALSAFNLDLDMDSFMPQTDEFKGMGGASPAGYDGGASFRPGVMV